ncbi:MAG: YkgJ family cysteine cluster protein [Deltaproteobacteria bacterium]|nr:YkgJ family cysteine cluster protein [Deltaproteobacteria bacterium]MBW2015466.1 YkgJ family cysteine cluster protein [Deltaproteobacteria bacterium]MBW2128415.1 YkgJ family cysteine cluster protein [Deltaproteobacteria bacterium]MBW2303886.1 YkgJ family cysteine cluster protein [Deltaproteobacteria bacterium]
MIPADLLNRYENLILGADRAFQKIEREYPQEVLCRIGCSDCCHALFGLFLIEAAYIKGHFEGLDRKERREVLARCVRMNRDLERFQKNVGPGMETGSPTPDILGKARIRCPLLDDEKRCVLYPSRPLTCRVYGIPTRIRGKARVCGKAGFNQGRSYPAFNLDEAQQILFLLSREWLIRLGTENPGKASLLISLARALESPLDEILRECYV